MVEGRGWIERALAIAADTPAPPRAKALQDAANLGLDLGDLAAARAGFEAALTLRRDGGDAGHEQGAVNALNGLGLVAHYGGDYPRAQALHEEALAVRRRLGDRRGEGNSLSNLGHAALCRGDRARARVLYEEALAVRRGLGTPGPPPIRS